MSTNLVNLDAIIRREDWDSAESTDDLRDISSETTFKIIEFEKTGLAFQFLKKPEFPRETASWEPEKVVDLVKCFLERELIPSIILWKNEESGNIFVIDGAHRLSALIAWVHNDYGDQQISQPFFKYKIPPEQKKAADKTRTLMAASVGSYETIKNSGTLPATEKHGKYARTLTTRSIVVQWITGTSQKAEASFFKINQLAAPIHPTELQLIELRKKPTGIAARALIRSGVGHKFWGGLPANAQMEIETTAKEVYDMLFEPELKSPITAGLNLPLAGRGYSSETVSLMLEFVNVATDQITPKSSRKPKASKKRVDGQQQDSAESQPQIPDDVDGAATIDVLKKIKRITDRMTSKLPLSFSPPPCSLFLQRNRQVSAPAFLATAALVKELEKTDKFIWFTTRRKIFETFLLGHRYLINQTVTKYGGLTKSLSPVLKMYNLILDLSDGENQPDAIIASITKEFTFIREDQTFTFSEADFSTNVKNVKIRRDGIAKLPICEICGAPINPNSISFDHTQDLKNGGKGNPENAGFSHPFCNSAKDKIKEFWKPQ